MTHNANKNGDKDKDDDFLDTFLTTIESKLRGPFSSLDLAKAVTTTALRGSLTPPEYLRRMSQVFSRTDKVIQSRMLIGLLGLDDYKKQNDQTNSNIYDLLEQAQQNPPHNEEWVRTIAGLVQGIMFQDSQGERCRGKEAKELLQKTCEEICERVEEELHETDEEKAQTTITTTTTLNCPDLNVSFAPYRYSLLSQELVKPILPEACDGANPHFKVNEFAAILQIDAQLESQRAKEEKEHQGPIVNRKLPKSSTATTSAASLTKADLPPGYRAIKLVPTKGTLSKPKTNMFMPKAKSNPLLAKRNKALMMQKTVLRKKGAAQSLVNNSSMKARSATGGAAGAGASTSTATTATAKSAAGPATAITGGGRTAGKLFGRSSSAAKSKLGGRRAMAARSKMKMLDVNEVDSLNKEHAKREQDQVNSRMSKKRRILESAKNIHKKAKTTTPSAASATASTPKDKTASASTASVPQTAAQEAPKQQLQAAPQSTTAATPLLPSATDALEPMDVANTINEVAGAPTEEWQVLLQERSNKLSQDDRQRVQQFFENHYNPSPDEAVYKMKLHEQRTQDPKTGQAIKETFYLELDYHTFTSKQSKKVKRY